MAQKSGIGDRGKKKTKFQHNYMDVVKNLVPDLYVDTDRSVYGQEQDVLYTVLGKILKTAQTPSSLFDISGIPASSIHQHYVTRNGKCHIRPYILDNKLFRAFGKRISSYQNYSDFSGFVSSTVLPAIEFNRPRAAFVSGASEILSSVTNASTAHDHLFDTLSWFYMLNTSGPAGGWDPSAGVLRVLSEKAFYGKTITLTDGIQLLFEFLWRNRNLDSTASGDNIKYSDYIPYQFLTASSSDISGIGNFYSSTQSYVSGDLPLSGLKTLIDVWYNSGDELSTTIEDSLSLLLTTGAFPDRLIEAGPFTKFLRAVSLGFYDANTVAEDLADLIDIQRCPPQFLKYLGALIGWNLRSGDIDRWRAQLRHATYLYKSKGTQRCLEDALALIFPNAGFKPLENFYSTFESFIPRLIYYLIATEGWAASSGEYHQNLNWVPEGATTNFQGSVPVKDYPYVINHIVANRDANLRFLTDYALERLNTETNAIRIGGNVFSANTWDPDDEFWPGFYHRGKLLQIPPWENDRFYEETRVSPDQIEKLKFILSGTFDSGGFEVSPNFVSSLEDFVSASSINSPLLEGTNTRWKFLTSSLNQPPNLEEVIDRFDSKAMGLADHWNSKSSTLVAEIETSSFTYDLDGMSMDTSAVVNSVAEILRAYIPFHAIFRLLAKEILSDVYVGQDKTFEFGDGIQATMDPDDGGTDYDYNVLRGYRTTSYLASAVGITFPSSVMVTYTNRPRTTRRRRNLKTLISPPKFMRDGRSMPLAREFAGSGPPSGDMGSFLHKQQFGQKFIPYGYNFSTGYYYSPSGVSGSVFFRGEPTETGLEPKYDLAMTGISGTIFTHAQDNTYNRFDPDTFYNRSTNPRPDSELTLYGQPVTGTFPCRGYIRTGGLGARKRNELTPQQKALYGRAVRMLASEGNDPFSSPNTLQNLRFGHEFHKLYRYYVREFDRRLMQSSSFKDRVDSAANKDRGGKQFSHRKGGFGVVEHAYGPLVYNSDFSIRGPLAAGEYDSSLFLLSSVDSTTTVGDVEESHYLTANEYCRDITLSMQDPDTLGNVVSYTLSGTGVVDANTPSLGRFLSDSSSKWSVQDPQRKLLGRHRTTGNFRYHNTPVLVSGVELILDKTTTIENYNRFIAVYNQPGSKFVWEHGKSTESTNGLTGSISLITPSDTRFNTLQGIRFSLNKGKDRFLDSEFKYFPEGWELGPSNFPETTASALAGWELYDVSTFPVRDTRTNIADNHGSLSVSALSGDIVNWSDYPDAYTPKDQYAIAATVSGYGDWGSPGGVTIQAQRHSTVGGVNQDQIQGMRNQLIPNQPYKLSVTAKSDNADCSGYRIIIKNVTHGDAQYSPSGGGTWLDGDGLGLPVADRINFPAPQDTTAANNGWTTCSITFTPSAEFGVGDNYDISIYPHGPYNSGWTAAQNTVLFESIKLETASSVGEYNNLHPEHSYEATVRVYAPGGNTNLSEYSLDFRLLSDPIPRIPNVWKYKDQGNGNMYFDFVNQVWVMGDQDIDSPGETHGDASRITVNLETDSIPSPDFPIDSGWRDINLIFHTRNIDGPPTGSERWQRHGSLLHTPSTPYCFEILAPQGGFAPQQSNVNLKGVTIDNVDIIDLNMNDTTFDYEEGELVTVFEMFNKFSDGKQSRSFYNVSDASPSGDFQTSGGSRDYYLEQYGGGYSGVSSNNILGPVGGATLGTPSGIVYEVSDD